MIGIIIYAIIGMLFSISAMVKMRKGLIDAWRWCKPRKEYAYFAKELASRLFMIVSLIIAWPVYGIMAYYVITHQL